MALPDLPAAATAHTPDGAAAFARYYLELVNYAWQKPDPAPLKKHSDPTCTACAGYVQDAAGFVRQEVRVDAPPFQVMNSDPGAILTTGEQGVIVVARQAPYRLVNRQGQASAAVQPADLRMQFYAIWREGGWHAAEIEKVN